MKHPEGMGEQEVRAFLTALGVEKRVAASTQNQALAALLFLHRDVFGRPLEGVAPGVRARRPERLPVVLTADETRRLLGAMSGPAQLPADLLYGSGLRLMEALELRVKDLDFERMEILVRDGKGRKDRVTMLPGSFEMSLRDHLEGTSAARSGSGGGRRTCRLA
jgi:integrase